MDPIIIDLTEDSQPSQSQENPNVNGWMDNMDDVSNDSVAPEEEIVSEASSDAEESSSGSDHGSCRMMDPDSDSETQQQSLVDKLITRKLDLQMHGLLSNDFTNSGSNTDFLALYNSINWYFLDSNEAVSKCLQRMMPEPKALQNLVIERFNRSGPVSFKKDPWIKQANKLFFCISETQQWYNNQNRYVLSPCGKKLHDTSAANRIAYSAE